MARNNILKNKKLKDKTIKLFLLKSEFNIKNSVFNINISKIKILIILIKTVLLVFSYFKK